MKLTLKQHDIAEALRSRFTCIAKIDAIKFVKKIFGSAADLRDIVIAFNSIEEYS